MFRFVYNLLGWALLVLVPSLLLYVYIMLYRELPEHFRARARKAFRHPAWAVHRSAGKFWRYSSQLQWFAVLFLGALALISIGEYGFGIFVLFLSSVSLLSKVAHWEGLSQNPGWSAFLKGLGSVGVVVLFSMFLLIAWGVKGNNPWSHLPDTTLKLIDEWRPIPTIPLFVAPHQNSPIVSHTPEVMLLAAQLGLAELRRPKPPALPSKASDPLPDGSVTTWIAYGDDNAVLAMSRLPESQNVETLTCAAPFTCLSEDQLKSIRINLNLDGKTKRRLIFMIANTGTDTIQTPSVNVALSYNTLADVTGISLSSPSQNTTGPNNAGLDWVHPNDFIPYSTGLNTYDLALDLEVKESSPSDFSMAFKVSAPHLKAHIVPVYVHIVRN